MLNSTVTSLMLKSPFFPRNYPDNTNCVWLVTASEGFVVTFNFTSLDLETGDFIAIGNGHSYFNPTSVIARFSDSLPIDVWITASQHRAWVVFRSDGSGTRTGFSATLRREIAQSRWHADILRK